MSASVPLMALAEAIQKDKDFDWQKLHLITPSKALDHLISYGSKVRLQPHVLGSLIFGVKR